MTDSKSKGDSLEKDVEKMYKRLGKWCVKRDVILKDRFGNISQIDVRYGLFRRFYVDCKNYSGHPVHLSDVAKFKEVLSLNGIPLHRGIFITTSTYVPRALTIGMKTYDGRQLERLQKISLRWRNFRMLTYLSLPILFLASVDSPENKIKEYSQQFVLFVKKIWK